MEKQFYQRPLLNNTIITEKSYHQTSSRRKQEQQNPNQFIANDKAEIDQVMIANYVIIILQILDQRLPHK